MPAGHKQDGIYTRKERMICAPESQHLFNRKVTFCVIKMQRIT